MYVYWRKFRGITLRRDFILCRFSSHSRCEIKKAGRKHSTFVETLRCMDQIPHSHPLLFYFRSAFQLRDCKKSYGRGKRILIKKRNAFQLRSVTQFTASDKFMLVKLSPDVDPTASEKHDTSCQSLHPGLRSHTIHKHLDLFD